MNFLHNMSAPPRTSFKICGRVVSGHTQIVSFVWALAHQTRCNDSSLKAALPARDSRGRRRGIRWDFAKNGIPRIGHTLPETLAQLAQKLREAFASPADLFAELGQPVVPQWPVDFLIGYRVRYKDLEAGLTEGGLSSPVFCEDPLLCAGILSRCAGSLFLSRRKPILSWDTLLDLPLAFDDHLIQFS